MPTFAWVESECGHYGSPFGDFGASGGRVGLAIARGLQPPPGPIPQSAFPGKGLARMSRKIGKPPGGRGVSGETGLGGNVSAPRPSLQSH